MRLQTLVPSTRTYGSMRAATWRTVAKSTPRISAHRSSGAATGRANVGSRAFQACMPGSVDEQVFERQWHEADEVRGHRHLRQFAWSTVPTSTLRLAGSAGSHLG